MTKGDAVRELLTRGVSEIIGKEDLERALLSGEKLRIKLGIDPTSPNLHVGRAVQLLKLRDFQNLGHQIVFIVGDFTGVIGDTSDKESERPMLTRKKIEENMKTYIEQAQKIIDFSKIEVTHNSAWLSKLTFEEIGEQADQFSVAEFTARENIKKRLDEGKRVSLREMLYPLMQGYDSVIVKADVELGGTDQRFNMLAGRRLQEYYKQKPQSIVMSNIIEGADGRKMSSSWGNTINLTDTPDDMFGKVMSIPDNLISTYFVHCTRVPMENVKAIEQDLKSGANPRDAKMRLAREIVVLYHGEGDSKKAEERFVSVFQKKERPEDIHEFRVSEKRWNILDLMVASKLVESKGEARRVIEQKGLSVNDVVIADQKHEVEIPKEGLVLKKGKRHFVKIVAGK